MPLRYASETDLSRISCDVIVNFLSDRFTSHLPALQPEVEPFLQQPLMRKALADGKIVVSHPRRFAVRYVFHIPKQQAVSDLPTALARLLRAAKKYGCDSVALPIPHRIGNERSLEAVRREIQPLLSESEINVILLLPERRLFLPPSLRKEVNAFLSRHYSPLGGGLFGCFKAASASDRFDECYDESDEYCGDFDEIVKGSRLPSSHSFDQSLKEASTNEAKEDDGTGSQEDLVCDETEEACEIRKVTEPYQKSDKSYSEFPDLESALRQLDDSFPIRLMKLIDAKGMDDVTCYKKANVSRQTWHKIVNSPRYRPSKTTVLAFAIALELSKEETDRLLEAAGYSLSRSYKADVIVEYFLLHKIYDIDIINQTLFAFDQECLG